MTKRLWQQNGTNEIGSLKETLTHLNKAANWFKIQDHLCLD